MDFGTPWTLPPIQENSISAGQVTREAGHSSAETASIEVSSINTVEAYQTSVWDSTSHLSDHGTFGADVQSLRSFQTDLSMRKASTTSQEDPIQTILLAMSASCRAKAMEIRLWRLFHEIIPRLADLEEAFNKSATEISKAHNAWYSSAIIEHQQNDERAMLGINSMSQCQDVLLHYIDQDFMTIATATPQFFEAQISRILMLIETIRVGVLRALLLLDQRRQNPAPDPRARRYYETTLSLNFDMQGKLDESFPRYCVFAILAQHFEILEDFNSCPCCQAAPTERALPQSTHQVLPVMSLQSNSNPQNPRIEQEEAHILIKSNFLLKSHLELNLAPRIAFRTPFHIRFWIGSLVTPRIAPPDPETTCSISYGCIYCDVYDSVLTFSTAEKLLQHLAIFHPNQLHDKQYFELIIDPIATADNVRKSVDGKRLVNEQPPPI